MGNFSPVVVVSLLCSPPAVAWRSPMSNASRRRRRCRSRVQRWRGRSRRGDIVVVGGLMKDGRASARADRYVPSKNRWEPLPALPVALHHTAATEFLARVWVIGGYTIDQQQWRESARAFSLGVDERAWREEPPLPASRARTPRSRCGIASSSWVALCKVRCRPRRRPTSRASDGSRDRLCTSHVNTSRRPRIATASMRSPVVPTARTSLTSNRGTDARENGAPKPP